MQMLSADEAAELLHLNVKRVQALARGGKLPATRVGRKWLFPRAELEARLSAGSRRPAEAHAVEISARNQLRGRIVAIEVEGLMAEVRLSICGQELTSVITRASVERLGLTVGADALAIIKSTEIMIGRA